MIRDPSDGSVREKPKPEDGSLLSHPMPAPEPGMASGLPTASTKPEQIDRLNKSREWLQDYHAKKNA